MCGGGGSAPTQPTVDPAAERQKAADEAARKANAALTADRRRRRGQQGLLSNDQPDTVLSRAVSSTASPRRTKGSSVLGVALDGK